MDGYNKFSGEKVNELKDVLKGKKEGEMKSSAQEENQSQESKKDQEQSEDVQTLKEEIKRLHEELKKASDQNVREKEDFVRKIADYDNSRKRLEREKEESVKFANEKLLTEFFTVFDSLEMSLSAAGTENESNHDAIKEGVELVIKQFKQVLEKFDVEIIAGAGEPFDPNKQEAIGSNPSADIPENHVIEVLRKGFILGGRVIRAAMVTVSSGKG